MNNWRWANPRAFRDQVDHSNSQTTRLGNIQCTSEHFSWYGSDDPRAKIEPPSCRLFKPGNLLAVTPLNWDKIIGKDDDNDSWAEPGAPSSGRSHPGNGNDKHNVKGEEDTQGGEKGTGKWKRTKDKKGKGNGKRKGNGKGKGIVK
jgi:hypothetical protein